MLIALFNNLPELIMGATWTAVVFVAGAKFAGWKSRRSAGAR